MIEISNFKKSYGNEIVVDDISLSVNKGSIFGFLGQNGAGKTTTMKMAVGITNPDSGNVTIDGGRPTDESVREKIGFMPESAYFYDRLTGIEFLSFCGELFKKKMTEKHYEEILKKVGIYEARNKPIRVYSKGMKQRLGFAQAIVNDPEYIFLDEPLDGLDPLGRREIKEIIKTLNKEGRTIFFNSHILYDTEELCDEIGIIHKGKLLYAGNTKVFCDGKPLEEQFIIKITEKLLL